MDPVVPNKFEDLVRAVEGLRGDFQSSSERIKRRISDAESAHQLSDAAVDARISSLEHYAAAQYTAAVVADNWGGHFEDRISDLEKRVLDLELVRYVEIQDERDARVEALESAAEAYEAWRPRIESSLFTLCSEVDAMRGAGYLYAEFAPSPELTAARPLAGVVSDMP